MYLYEPTIQNLHLSPGGSCEERVKTVKKSIPGKYLLHWAEKDQYAFLVLFIHLKGLYIICVLSNKNPHGSAGNAVKYY